MLSGWADFLLTFLGGGRLLGRLLLGNRFGFGSGFGGRFFGLGFTHFGLGFGLVHNSSPIST